MIYKKIPKWFLYTGAIPLILAVTGIGYFIVDKAVFQLEKNNKFCISCHLHEEKYEKFITKDNIPENLAGWHYLAKNEKKPAGHHSGGGHNHKNIEVRCIDCHKGEGIIERAGVLYIAGFDTLKFFAGRYKEPETQKFKLSDASCLKCHKNDLIPKSSYADKYHARMEHYNIPYPCTSCHIIHKDGQADLKFINEEIVIPICQECHPAMNSG